MEAENEKLHIDVSFHFFSIDPDETKPMIVDGNSEMYSSTTMHVMSSKVMRELERFGMVRADGSKCDLWNHVCKVGDRFTISFSVSQVPVIHFDEALVPLDMNELTFHVWHFHHAEVDGRIVTDDKDLIKSIIRKIEIHEA